MFCKNCGNKLSKTDKFCNECGTQIIVETEKITAQVSTEATKETYTLDKWAFWTSLIGVFGFGLLSWIGLVMGIAAINEMKSKYPSMGQSYVKWAIGLGLIFGPIKSVLQILVNNGY